MARRAHRLRAAARGARDSDSDSDDEEDDDEEEEEDAPTFARGPNGEMACEMRRVGDAEWRVFTSRKDAGRAFSVASADVSKLIKDSPDCHLRGRFEARNCAPPADAVYSSHACEVRRVGDKKWRRFASRADAAAAFPGLSNGNMVSRLIANNPTTAKLSSTVRGKFEARNVGDDAPRRPRSPPVSAAALAAAARSFGPRIFRAGGNPGCP